MVKYVKIREIGDADVHDSVLALFADTDGVLHDPKVLETGACLTVAGLPTLPRKFRRVTGRLSDGTPVRGLVTKDGDFVVSMPDIGPFVAHAVLSLETLTDERCAAIAMWLRGEHHSRGSPLSENFGLDEKTERAIAKAKTKALKGVTIPELFCVKGVKGVYGPAIDGDGTKPAHHTLYVYLPDGTPEEMVQLIVDTLAAAFKESMRINMPKFKRWDQERQVREAAEAAKAAKGPPAKRPVPKVSPAAAKKAAADAQAAEKAKKAAAVAAKTAAKKAADAARDAPFKAAEAAVYAANARLAAIKAANSAGKVAGIVWRYGKDRVRIELASTSNEDVAAADEAQKDAVAKQTAERTKLNLMKKRG